MKEILYHGSHANFVRENGWEFADRKSTGVVGIVAITGAGEIILIEQYRKPVKSRVVELPAGLVGDDGDASEDHADAARRELLEETGYDAPSYVPMSQGPPSAGLTSEVVRLFLARNAARAGDGGGVGGEKISVHLVPTGRVRAWLAEKEREGTLVDPKVYAGLWLAGVN